MHAESPPSPSISGTTHAQCAEGLHLVLFIVSLFYRWATMLTSKHMQYKLSEMIDRGLMIDPFTGTAETRDP